MEKEISTSKAIAKKRKSPQSSITIRMSTGRKFRKLRDNGNPRGTNWGHHKATDEFLNELLDHYEKSINQSFSDSAIKEVNELCERLRLRGYSKNSVELIFLLIPLIRRFETDPFLKDRISQLIEDSKNLKRMEVD